MIRMKPFNQKTSIITMTFFSDNDGYVPNRQDAGKDEIVQDVQIVDILNR